MATIKQQEAIKNVVENGGNVTRAMIDAGYSPNSANNPKVLTESNGWQELMEKYFPDEVLTKKIQEGLGATKVISARVIFKKNSPTNITQEGEMPTANSRTDDFIEVPDYAVQHKFVETALKIKKKMPELGDKENPFKVELNIDIGEALKKIYGSRNNGSSGAMLNGST